MEFTMLMSVRSILQDGLFHTGNRDETTGEDLPRECASDEEGIRDNYGTK
jgi:hypothetical protein